MWHYEMYNGRGLIYSRHMPLLSIRDITVMDITRNRHAQMSTAQKRDLAGWQTEVIYIDFLCTKDLEKAEIGP